MNIMHCASRVFQVGVCRRLFGRVAQGQIAVKMAILLPVLLLLAGLVIDGGVMLVQYRHGQIALDSAAFAAAVEADEKSFMCRMAPDSIDRCDQKILIDVHNTKNAYYMAVDYAQKNGAGVLKLTSIDVSDNKVTVCGAVKVRTLIMRIVGINEVPFVMCSAAELKYGISEEGQ